MAYALFNGLFVPDGVIMNSCFSRERRFDLLACCFLVAVVLLAGSCRAFWPACGYLHDDAIYLSTARSLHEGSGYVLVDLPGCPPQTKYPPLYPALLAALFRIWPAFPDNLVLFKAFSLLSAAIFLATFYAYLVRFHYLSRAAALGACLLPATGPYFVDTSSSVMSEMLFGVLAVALLWRLDSLRQTPRQGLGADLLTGLLLALPFLCRSIGVVFLPLGIFLLYRWGRPWLRPAVFAALFVLPWIAWSMRAALAQRVDPVQGYYTDYLGWWMSFGPPVLGRIVGKNALYLVSYIAGLPAEGVSTFLGSLGPAFMVLPMLCVGLIGFAVLGERAARAEAMPVLLVGYLLVVLVWPWNPTRFLLPVMPALVCFVMLGLWQLVSPRLGEVTTWRLGIVLVGGCLVANVYYLTLRTIRSHQYGTPAGDDGTQAGRWSDFKEIIGWVIANTDESDVLASGSDALLGLYTRRKAFYPIVCSPLSYIYGMPDDRNDDLERSLASLRRYRPRYLILTAGFHGEKDFRIWVKRLVAAYPKHVKIVRTGADPRFTIYQINYPLTPQETP